MKNTESNIRCYLYIDIVITIVAIITAHITVITTTIIIAAIILLWWSLSSLRLLLQISIPNYNLNIRKKDTPTCILKGP